MTDVRHTAGLARSSGLLPSMSPRSFGGGGRTLDPTARQRRDNILFGFFIVQTLAITVFQKIGFGGSIDSMVPLALIVMLAGLGLTMLFVRPVFDITRVGIYVGFVVLATLSTSLFAPTYSAGSLGLLVLLYLPMAVSFPTSDGNYRRCMNFFSNVMLVMAAIAMMQHVIQIGDSWLAWPSLDRMLPQSILIQGFNYVQPIAAGGHLMKPNAVFFLEVSFLSQYLALALAAEIVLFQRLWRIGVFAAVMLASFAGTGLLLLVLTFPVLIGRLRIKPAAAIIFGLVLISLVAFDVGWFDSVARRTTEFRHTGASANLRFVAPLDRVLDFVRTSPGAIYSGIGAGQIEKVGGAQWWPITKAVVEYGLLSGVLFYAFIFYALLSHPPYRRLAFTLAVWFSIEGALLTAVNPLTCALFSTLFVLDRGPKRQRRQNRQAAVAESQSA